MLENITADERRELADIFDKLAPEARKQLLSFAKNIAGEVEPQKAKIELCNSKKARKDDFT